MFDWYSPDPAIQCPQPSCGAVVSDWQGKDGPCVLVLWRQGTSEPIEQRVDEPVERAALAVLRLPGRFFIHADCPNGHRIEAEGEAPDGTWTRTHLLMA